MRRQHRWAMTGGALLLAAALTTACSPEPAPTPTPTGFASEEEAFEAAEAAVADYIAATNAIVISEPATYEALFDLTTGAQNQFDRKRLSEYHANDYVVRGETRIIASIPRSWDSAAGTAKIDMCLDVATVDVLDANGVSIVAADRPDRQSMTATVESSGSRALIRSISTEAAADICD